MFDAVFFLDTTKAAFGGFAPGGCRKREARYRGGRSDSALTSAVTGSGRGEVTRARWVPPVGQSPKRGAAVCLSSVERCDLRATNRIYPRPAWVSAFDVVRALRCGETWRKSGRRRRMAMGDM